MRIYLTITEKHRWLFFADNSPLVQFPRAGVESRNWFLTKLVAISLNIRRAIEEAQSPLMVKVRQGLKYLESRIDSAERMMMQMRKRKLIEIVYPASLKDQLVRRRFIRFVRRRTRHHTRWLAINVLLLPLTAIMTPIPGPNIFFGWNAFRVISHYLAREGGKSVLRGNCQLVLIPAPEEEIDSIVHGRLGLQRETSARFKWI